MKKLFAIVVCAAFAATSLGALAQEKKKMEVKAKQGGGVTAADKSAVTTATGKKKEMKDGPAPKNIGKRKTEKERMDEKKK